MINPADQAIAELIEKFTVKAAALSTSDEDRQTYVNQIAQLRAAMNPRTHQPVN